jgi:ATP-dependent DNA helicase RecQ
VRVLVSGEVKWANEFPTSRVSKLLKEQYTQRSQAAEERLEEMRSYANTSNCRREHLLRYFGDDFSGPCGNCDNCEATAPPAETSENLGTRREVV